MGQGGCAEAIPSRGSGHDGRMFPSSQMYCEGRPKPYLRGVFHAVGVLALLPLAVASLLATEVDQERELTALCVLALGTASSWAPSALFHCVPWPLAAEICAQKLDHCGVFVTIAATYSSFALLLLPLLEGPSVLLVRGSVALLWAAALGGVLHVLWRRGERMGLWVGTALLSLPSYPSLSSHLTLDERALAVLGLLCFAAGALIYGRRLCNLWPGVLGPHEVFHLLTLLGAACAFLLLASLCQPLPARCSARAEASMGFEAFKRALALTLSSPRDVCGG